MKENKFKVWCEYEFGDEIVKEIAGPESWFLLTQTGKLMTYGPNEPLRPAETEYKKAIPLFYTGKEDDTGKEICQGDILEYSIDGHKQDSPYIVEDIAEWFEAMYDSDDYFRWDSVGKIIGNKYENPEILK